jgi:signal transduction histidine kinase
MNLAQYINHPSTEQGDTRLLLVDDRPENLYALRQILAPEGYVLDLAPSGVEALRLLLRNRYACILCDVQMPQMSGLEFVKLVRADPTHSETAVMFITAFGGTNERLVEALELGALDYVTKPVEPQVLRAKVRVFVSLEQKRVEIARQRDLFHAAMSSLHEGVLVTDGATGAVFINDAMKQMYGGLLEPRSALGQLQALEVYAPSTRERLPESQNPFFLAEKAVGVLDRQIQVFTDSGEESYWNVSVLPIPSIARSAPIVAVVVRDVTAERDAMTEIQRKNRDLEQYAYAASHDLKAPLRHIRSFGNILQQELQGEENPAVQSALSFMIRAAEDMRELIDGLLQLSTAGAQALQRETIFVAQLVEEIWETELADVAPTDAILEKGDEDAVVWADRTALRRVLVNLLENSVKFRRPDVPLVISVNVEASSTMDRVIVRDNGIGVAPEHAERVFQVFQRLHPKGEYDGCGIGLALCKKVLELHSGRIWLSQDAGQSWGTTVVLELPRAKPGSSPRSGFPGSFTIN